jgi:hypothetical protein
MAIPEAAMVPVDATPANGATTLLELSDDHRPLVFRNNTCCEPWGVMKPEAGVASFRNGIGFNSLSHPPKARYQPCKSLRWIANRLLKRKELGCCLERSTSNWLRFEVERQVWRDELKQPLRHRFNDVR